ncbi:Allergen Fus c 3 [Madurella mycetomatis]|uniref:Allergen Fus c 3 n=1 Tax=Madurella mycetomatis TaxID=100816 RepID=A0A175VMV5_9PEZI|nr:Allergen Fus c 3 [Madurella mycetomatis]
MDHYDGDSSGLSDGGARGPDISRVKARKRRSRDSGSTKAAQKSRPCPRAHEDTAGTPHGQASPSSQCRARKRHSIVEQQYRHRLNRQYEQLLDTLPTTMSAGTGTGVLPQKARSSSTVSTASRTSAAAKENGSPHSGGPLVDGVSMAAAAVTADLERGERRMSKAEVLDRARLYIESLEREHRRLVAEKRELRMLWDEHAASIKKKETREQDQGRDAEYS